MWAAKLVLESEPKFLRQFFLFEQDRRKVAQLEALRAAQPRVRGRRIEIFAGNFNSNIAEILRATTIKEKEATFCLLDQRTTECSWSTVEAIASHKRTVKIELFYFLGTSWMGRALQASKTTEKLTEVEAWWGRADWRKLLDLSQLELVERMRARLQELGYAFVIPYPIYAKEMGRRVMYHMLHATDHPAAPMLMRRAYSNAVGQAEPLEQLRLELGWLADQTDTGSGS